MFWDNVPSIQKTFIFKLIQNNFTFDLLNLEYKIKQTPTTQLNEIYTQKDTLTTQYFEKKSTQITNNLISTNISTVIFIHFFI